MNASAADHAGGAMAGARPAVIFELLATGAAHEVKANNVQRDLARAKYSLLAAKYRAHRQG